MTPVLSTICFRSLVGLLIEINHLFQDALTFLFLINMRRGEDY
ncbi:hypothetical protein VitviT2T_015578 [Vitis vinifera]|uniref:PSI-J n=1 Tax=Vitis vinifera TaxID=29760 RepID=A0ABY9CQP8_VITVI|nr:hypothetical protein VitviT2T_015578 [Vitis vinifera]